MSSFTSPAVRRICSDCSLVAELASTTVPRARRRVSRLIGVPSKNQAERGPMWESGLPAIAVGQAIYSLAVSPPSRASPAPTGSGVDHWVCGHTEQMWERQTQAFFGGVGLASKVCGGATCRVVTEPCSESE